MKIIARYGFNPVLCGILYLHALCVGHGEYLSVHSFQIFLVFYFQADDALVVSPGKSQDLGCQAVVGIIPFVVLIHLDPCQPVGTYLVPQLFVHIGLDDFPGTALLHPFSHQLLIQIQFIAQYPYDLLPVLYLIVYDGNGTNCPVISDDDPVGVNDTPPGRLNGTLPLVQVLGHGAVML